MQEALAETQAELRSCIRGRYVGADLFHVTLAFLGRVDACHVDELAHLIDEACEGHAAFDACLGELGYFGKRGKAVLWQGFTSKASFAALAESVRGKLKDAGFDFDGKGFLPHVTLMRNADLSSATLPMPAIARGNIASITLFSSDLTGERPVYEPLATSILETAED